MTALSGFFRRVNFKGDAVATIGTYLAQGLVKFGSSLILTRILQPSAYGIIAILTSIAFTLAMLSDLGTHICVSRSPDGDKPEYLNTAWTLRFVRCVGNGVLVFFLAPAFASLYGDRSLAEPLRWFGLWFLIDAFESNSYLVAFRRKNMRIVVHSDLAANMTGTLVSIALTLYLRDFRGMLFGILATRAVYVGLSYAFYRDQRPRLTYQPEVAREIFRYTRVVLPSSIISLVIGQFDKTVFLRLFDLQLLGLYGLAGTLAGQVELVISRMIDGVVYPRCAYNFRTDPDNSPRLLYSENARILALCGALVGGVWGGAHLIIQFLYDPRYAAAAGILQILMVRASLQIFSGPSRVYLVSAGKTMMMLMTNIVQAVSIVVGAGVGYYLGGFHGFVYGMALSGVPVLIYFFRLQHGMQALNLRYEAYKLAYVVAVAVVVYAASSWFLSVVHVSRLHMSL